MANTQHHRRTSLVRLTREALAILAARRTVTAIVMLIAAVGAFIPLAISAGAQNARSDALTALDRPEQRIVRITDNEFDQPSATLDPATVSQLRELSIVDNLIALGTVQDTRPAAGWPTSERIPMVDVLSVDGGQDDPCGSVRLPQTHRGSTRTLHLALEPAFIAVVGQRQTEAHPFADPGLATRSICDWTSARRILALVDEPASVQRLVGLVGSFGGLNLSVSVPDDLEELRQDVATGLSDSARQLRNLAMLGAGFLVGATTFATNTAQTRHMARRRALGATRSDVAILILAQVGASVVAGVLIAVSAFTAGDAILHYPIAWSLVMAVAVNIGLTSLLASLPVALIAANRDPARVLRVP
ncbi:MAG: hypothetical protein OXN44_01095 [Acidimicrobiaceae bacterium]|nr:hypothetical protein [Acidimicrobiaceae bacterium]